MKTALWILFFSLQPLPLLWANPFGGARDSALGGMVVSDPDTGTCLFINPACLGKTENLETSFSQARISADNLDFEVGASFPILKGQVGIGLGWDAQVAQNQQEFGIVRDSNGQVVVDPTTGAPLTQLLGFFTQSDNTFYCSAGAQFGFCSLGASLKYYLSDFGNLEGSGWGIDLAFQASWGNDLSIASALYDFQDSLINFQGNAPNTLLPTTWTSSLNWRFWRTGDLSFLAMPGFSAVPGRDSTADWGGGLEAAWKNDAFLRLGFNQERLSFGVGLTAYPSKVFPEIKIDYAYLGGDTADFPSRLTLTTKW